MLRVTAGNLQVRAGTIAVDAGASAPLPPRR